MLTNEKHPIRIIVTILFIENKSKINRKNEIEQIEQSHNIYKMVEQLLISYDNFSRSNMTIVPGKLQEIYTIIQKTRVPKTIQCIQKTTL